MLLRDKRALTIICGAITCLMVGTGSGLSVAAANKSYDAKRMSFTVKVKDEVNPYQVLGVYVMPGEQINVECVFTNPGSTFRVTVPDGRLERQTKERWRWKAPTDQGLYPMTIADTTSHSIMTLNIFVMVPFSHQHERLDGYRIGRYQQTLYKNDPVYAPPQGFVQVTPDNHDVLVSPHFSLGQFLAKSTDGHPKYLLLRERLLLKLEMILEAVNEKGIQTSSLHIMSGFRTPFYNRSIGNRTVYSRHLYGGAADIFVDVDENNRMDDLNGDGRVTIADAVVLADIVKDKAKETWYQPFVGGLGIYGQKPHRGPFVHVDVRGRKARWTNP